MSGIPGGLLEAPGHRRPRVSHLVPPDVEADPDPGERRQLRTEAEVHRVRPPREVPGDARALALSPHAQEDLRDESDP